MQAVVVSPTATELVEVSAVRSDGPPRWAVEDRQRCDRVRSAITNTGFALPTGDIAVSVGGHGACSDDHDLAVALAVLLSDPAHAHLRRRGWIAWGAIGLDGSVLAGDEAFVNELPGGPCVGRIWAPDDRVPSPEDDAVISLVDVSDLRQAWDVIAFFAGAEEVILGTVNPPDLPVSASPRARGNE